MNFHRQMMNLQVPRDRVEGAGYFEGFRDARHAAAETALAADIEIERLRSALEFYAEHGAGCRLIHSEGDISRNALADDGGKRAQFALHNKEASTDAKS